LREPAPLQVSVIPEYYNSLTAAILLDVCKRSLEYRIKTGRGPEPSAWVINRLGTRYPLFTQEVLLDWYAGNREHFTEPYREYGKNAA